MKSNLKIAAMVSVLLFSISSWGHEPIEPVHRNVDDTFHDEIAKEVSMVGRLDCVRGGNNGNVVMVYLETDDGKGSMKLVDYSDKLVSLCNGERVPTKIQVVGTETSRFLLWGGNLSVRSFTVTQQ